MGILKGAARGLAKSPDEIAEALAKKRSKAAKKGAKTKAANRKAAEKVKAKRSRAGKKAKKTKDKNIKVAEKTAAKEEKAAKKARKEEHPGTKPVQKGLPDEYHERGGRPDAKHVVKTPEGAQEKKFSSDQPAAGEGPVTVGTKSGDIPNYIRDQMEELSPKRRAAVTEYFRNGESFKGMSVQKKRDAKYGLNYMRKEQEPVSISTRQAISEGGKKARAAKQPDAYDHMLRTGEILEGFNPTPKQIEQAIKNQKARGKTSRVRELEARLESLDPRWKYGGRKGAPFPGAGRPAGHPSDKVVEAGMVRKRGATPYQPKELKAEDDMTKLLMRTERRGFKRGGLIKKGHKDYRKGGMFY